MSAVPSMDYSDPFNRISFFFFAKRGNIDKELIWFNAKEMKWELEKDKKQNKEWIIVPKHKAIINEEYINNNSTLEERIFFESVFFIFKNIDDVPANLFNALIEINEWKNIYYKNLLNYKLTKEEKTKLLLEKEGMTSMK